MSKKEKLKEKFFNVSKSFLYTELDSMLIGMGFEKRQGSGSRVHYVLMRSHGENVDIYVHRPHPQKEIKAYMVKNIQQKLKKNGLA